MKSPQPPKLRTRRKLPIAAAVAAIALTAAACGQSSDSPDASDWREAKTAEDGGGMDALIKAAKAEGEFNAMGLFEDWANYGELLKTFGKKYGIKINNDTSTGASQDLINAVVNRKGQPDSLDYLDTGLTFAVDAEKDDLLATYSPETVKDIKPEFRSKNGTWINHLGGTIAIGCDTSRIKQCPKNIADLNDPKFKGKVAIPGDPTNAESAFMVVQAAAVANKGSFDDIQPGIDFFAKLKSAGIYLPVEPSLGTIEAGETPIVVNWDYLLKPIANDLAKKADIELEINLPEDGQVSSFYAASINADAPNPAVARLFFEFLFSDEGQNLLLKGYVSPIRLQSMVDAGTADEAAVKELPGGGGVTAPSPTLEQRTANQKVLKENWAKALK